MTCCKTNMKYFSKTPKNYFLQNKACALNGSLVLKTDQHGLKTDQFSKIHYKLCLDVS